ncbi:MAG: transketolase C-terminal domain-containing protein [Pseudomonadota bacterium]
MAVMSYADGILEGFRYLLATYPKCFTIGQGLWSPWYVGTTMKDLDKEFGKDRVIDTPVSELATTGAAIGASLHGYRPIVIHPRMDFMLLASDPIVNQAAKWRHMLGGAVSPAVTIRSIINRGGEQGAQHSQALHAWYAHIPGLRVVMPATPADARDLLISATLCDDPVVYIDDRWCYEWTDDVGEIIERPLEQQGPKVLRAGTDVTIAAAGYSTRLALDAAKVLEASGVSAEVVDVRVLNPFDSDPIVQSVEKTGRFAAIDGGWSTCGFSAELLATVAEKVAPQKLKAPSVRITLPDAPAPTSKALEEVYYPDDNLIAERLRALAA